MPQHHIISTATVKGLWNNWAIAFGSIVMVMFCSLFIPKTWLPLLLFALAYTMMAKQKADNSNSKIGSCNMIIWIAAIILFWSAVIMTTINILHAKWFFGGTFAVEPVNPKHPYVCSLILFPASLVVSMYFLIRGHKAKLCRNCQARFGYYPPNGIVANLYYNEARYQLRLLLWLSLVLSVVDWAYYYFFYINVNYNTPDKFYFIIMPIAIYAASLIYMTIRYMSMSDEMSGKSGQKQITPMMTLVRFLIFAGDAVYLGTDTDNYLDTPAKMIIPRTENLSVDDAHNKFADMSGLSDFQTKYIYTDSGYTNGANVLHFAVFLPQETDISKLVGCWCTIDELDRQLKSGRLTPVLVSEINRIYNVTMAWKTYDRDGKRLYPIKNYHPTFRLRDFKNWDVDYDDLHWLDVATNNEDRRFFRFRRFWRKNFKH